MQSARSKGTDIRQQAQAHNERGKQRIALGDYQGALESFFAAIDADSTSAAPYMNVASVCLEIGDRDHAIIYAAKALQLSPLDRNIFLTCGRILALSGHTEKARELYETYLLQFPLDSELQKRLCDLNAKH